MENAKSVEGQIDTAGLSRSTMTMKVAKSEDSFAPTATGVLALPKKDQKSLKPQPSILKDVPKDKAYPVREVYFSRLVRLPGYSGACNMARTTGEEANLGTNQARVKSLVIVEGTHNKLIVDGDYFMSFAGGAIDGWKY